MREEENSKIENLKKSLYSRNAPEIRTKRRLRFSDDDNNINTDWEHEAPKPILSELNKEYKNNSMSFFTRILLWSFMFFIISVGIGTLLVYKGSNIVSAKNVDISINGPVSISGGEPFNFQVQVSNQNNIKLETVDLAIEYPSGTTDVNDSFKELKNTRELIDDIAPGGVGQKSVSAVLYGEENSKKEIKVSVEYRVKGSNAIFQKIKTFDVLISSSPISINVTAFKEVNSGQEFEMTAVINSNSKEVIKNLLFKAYYPFGYTYISSDIKPLSDNSTWRIGDIPPGSKKTIKIRGKLDGQDDDLRVFKFSTGAFSVRNEKVIATEFTNNSHEVSIKKPFMTVKVLADGNEENQDYIGSFNQPIRVELPYFNNLQTPIIDGEIRVKLSGSAFDRLSVNTDDGLYNSSEQVIVWNGITNNQLRNIEGGGTGKVSFTIIPRDLSTVQKSISNPFLKIDVSVKGNRNSESNVPESLTSTVSKQVRIPSTASLTGQVMRTKGPFQNTGFIPPKSDQPTTYTIALDVDNTSNTVSNAIVDTSLPPYVQWAGKISPESEDIVYNQADGQIRWNIGNISTYTRGTSKHKQVFFQVIVKPSVTQIDQIPVILNQSQFTAQDDFTGETLKSNLGSLTTSYQGDPSYKEGDGRVTR